MHSRQGKQWTKKEDDFLIENWGEKTLKYLSKNLYRTEKAILERSNTLMLESYYNTGKYLKVKDISEIMSIHITTIYRWANRYAFPCVNRKFGDRKMKVCTIDSVLSWLKENQDKWDSSKIEKYAFGEEPKWLQHKRKKDTIDAELQYKLWTNEDTGLLLYYKKQGYTHKQIAKKLNKSKNSIDNKVQRLGKEGKVKLNISIEWSIREIEMMLEMELRNYSDSKIAWELGREVKDVVNKRYELRQKGLYQGTKEERVTRELDRIDGKTA